MSLVAEGPLIQVSGRDGSSSVERVGHVGDDLVGVDDADVEVGHQGDRATALAGAVVEHDRAGLGDAEPGAGDDGVEGVELGGGEAVVGARRPGTSRSRSGGTTTAGALGQRGADAGARGSAAAQRSTTAR